MPVHRTRVMSKWSWWMRQHRLPWQRGGNDREYQMNSILSTLSLSTLSTFHVNNVALAMALWVLIWYPKEDIHCYLA
jgi:hypothetical protein